MLPVDMTAQDAPMPGGADREALASMLSSYASDQLIQEVLSAWEDLSVINEEVAGLRQQNRVLELDLKEREDIGSPDRARLIRLEEDLRDREAQIIHLERLVDDGRAEIEEISVSSGAIKVESLERNNSAMATELEEKTALLVEMEAKVATLVDALEKAAEAGLTSVTAEEVRTLNQELEGAHRELESEKLEKDSVMEERDRLRDLVEQVKNHLEIRDDRIRELEEQLQRVMSGPRSVSAEHEYLTEQIEELKRRLVDRNREYEALRRRERRLHREVFDRDERIAQLQLTMQDIEAGLSDRTAELKALEEIHDRLVGEMGALRRSESTREVVNKAFRDSLNVVRAHEQVQARREAAGLATGLEPIDGPDGDIPAPGGSAPPALRNIDE